LLQFRKVKRSFSKIKHDILFMNIMIILVG